MRGTVRFALCAVFVAACSSGTDQGQQPRPDAPGAPTVKCGDGVCAPSELSSCVADCGTPPPQAVCGNGTCEATENPSSCPGDCSNATCGDGTCTSPSENATNCPGDCTSGGGASCGNGVCESGEDQLSCSSDCSSGGGTSTCPGPDPATNDIDCFFCWFDPTVCIPPQSEAACEQCLGLGP